MKRLHVLLGSADRRINSAVEMCVLDACYNIAAVEAAKVIQLGQFVRHSCLASFDLLILIPDRLLPEPTQPEPMVTVTQSVAAIKALRAQCSAPLLVVCGARDGHRTFLDAGANSVVPELFDTEALKAEVRRLLQLPAPAEEGMSTWSFASLFFRGLQRLKRA